jgi:CheY-like chemotaxis protein
MKKILLVDDQELVLMSLEKMLNNLGYQTESVKNIQDAENKIITKNYDLFLIDINLSDEKKNGLSLIKDIKKSKNNDKPIAILSGVTDVETISEAYELGAIDFLKKPLSMKEIELKITNILGKSTIINTENSTKKDILHNKCVGVVIPCYNEEDRLLSTDFIDFIDNNHGYSLCFVNDGSKDKTLDVLKKLQLGREDYITIYDCKKNGGKAEAVRIGMLQLAKQSQLDYIGFLDADLSINFEDFMDLVNTFNNSNYKVVSGSRIYRMGADIEKQSARAIISKTINLIIRKTLGMEFNDTQCGAKIMTKEIVNKTFQTKFITKWLFDVEIFMRMRNIFGLEETKKMLCEKPLNRWIHVDGSKLSFKDSLKIIGQIFQIFIFYRLKKQ